MDPDTTDRVQNVIESRHSSRAPFDPAWHVTAHELARILDAARWAPTAHNMQNFRLVVVDDAGILGELGRLLPDKLAQAPLVIVVVYDPTQSAPASPDDQLISLGCVMENMWLVAQAEHLDVQVVSAVARAGIEDQVKRALGVPAPWRIAYAMRFGHSRTSSHPPRERRPLETSVGKNHF